MMLIGRTGAAAVRAPRDAYVPTLWTRHESCRFTLGTAVQRRCSLVLVEQSGLWRAVRCPPTGRGHRCDRGGNPNGNSEQGRHEGLQQAQGLAPEKFSQTLTCRKTGSKIAKAE